MHLIESYKNLANVIKKGKSGEKSDKISFTTGGGMGVKPNRDKLKIILPQLDSFNRNSARFTNANLKFNVIFKATSLKVS